jgi:hypothetical protein
MADFVEIPIVGRIATGRPILAEEQIEDRIGVSKKLFPSGVLFDNSVAQIRVLGLYVRLIRQAR